MTTREIDLDIPEVADLRAKWAARQKETEGQTVKPAWNLESGIVGTVTQFPVRDDKNGVFDGGSCLVEWDDPEWGHGCYGLHQLVFVGEAS